MAGWRLGLGLPRRPGVGSRSLGTEQGEAWGTGTDLDVERQLWAQWEVAGDGWQAGDGHMEGRLALWQQLEHAPAVEAHSCQDWTRPSARLHF